MVRYECARRSINGLTDASLPGESNRNVRPFVVGFAEGRSNASCFPNPEKLCGVGGPLRISPTDA